VPRIPACSHLGRCRLVPGSSESEKPRMRGAGFSPEIDLSAVDEMEIPPRELPEKLVERGDLHVCEGGEIGRVALWTGEFEPIAFQNSVRFTNVAFFVRSVLRNLSRTTRKNFAGRKPYAVLSGPCPGRGRRSGPGHANTLASLTTTHDRSPSRPSRALMTAGISTASSVAVGVEWVIGSA
jgi:hypothetical protein